METGESQRNEKERSDLSADSLREPMTPVQRPLMTGGAVDGLRP